MVARSDLFCELVGPVETRVHGTAKKRLGRAKGRGNLPERRFADDHEIDVTLGSLSGPSDRAVDECGLNPLAKRVKRFTQRVDQSRSLRQ
jgi:hypothetical protein